MPTMWDKRAEDAAGKVVEAVKHEAEVIVEHNVETPAKVVEAVKHEAAVLVEHNTPVATDALAQAEQTANELQAKAHADAHAAADKIELHAAGLFGGIAQSLKDFAGKLRSGEEKLTEEVKAELAQIGVKL